MAKTYEEKQQGFIAAIGNCTSLSKLLKMNLASASPAVIEAFNLKKVDLEAESTKGLLTMVKDGEPIRVHPTQVAPWENLGYRVKEEE